jgi:imidazolonepropionase-like amidohydrolase
VVSGDSIKVGVGEFQNLESTILRISKPGYTLLPGLIDSHIHALNGNILAIEQSLRFGVTTACDMHNEAIHIAKLKQVSNPSNAWEQDCGLTSECSLQWERNVGIRISSARVLEQSFIMAGLGLFINCTQTPKK